MEPNTKLEQLYLMFLKNNPNQEDEVIPYDYFATFDYDKIYNQCFDLAQKGGYGIRDLESLAPCLEYLATRYAGLSRNLPGAGVFLSAATNAIIQDRDKLVLRLNKEFDNIGMMLPRGELIIKGNVGNNFAMSQNGGRIYLVGSCKDYLNNSQRGGTTAVGDNAGKQTCFAKEGGITIVGNKIKKLSNFILGGRIISKDMQIYPNKRQLHPNEKELYLNRNWPYRKRKRSSKKKRFFS